jgi:hypothetical protein
VLLDLVKFQLFKSSKHNLAFLAFPLIGPRFFVANIRRFLTFILLRLEIIEGMIIVHFVLELIYVYHGMLLTTILDLKNQYVGYVNNIIL